MGDVIPIRLIALSQRLGPFLLISFKFFYFQLNKICSNWVDFAKCSPLFQATNYSSVGIGPAAQFSSASFQPHISDLEYIQSTHAANSSTHKQWAELLLSSRSPKSRVPCCWRTGRTPPCNTSPAALAWFISTPQRYTNASSTTTIFLQPTSYITP